MPARYKLQNIRFTILVFPGLRLVQRERFLDFGGEIL